MMLRIRLWKWKWRYFPASAIEENSAEIGLNVKELAAGVFIPAPLTVSGTRKLNFTVEYRGEVIPDGRT